jgi:flagellar basal-body rod protein FlgB
VKIFEKTNIPLLSRALTAYSLRQKAIAANIANIATPGYRPLHVSFEEELASAVKGGNVVPLRTHEKHMAADWSQGGKPLPRIEVEEDERQLLSGLNTVDIDQQMGELAETQLRYRFAARMLSNTFKGIQKSIRGQL